MHFKPQLVQLTLSLLLAVLAAGTTYAVPHSGTLVRRGKEDGNVAQLGGSDMFL
ncbi:hypothetical protein K466DRAFT_590678 [Polyporus arcularius HHB13444]|uniref:Uncharacterized protein n=1 Tax=Polyporus arcularius HHB13444 TaxID=1314778 RepID=A0A5C3NXS2_9APHY|nr:hypothetical protein K466DRAFT_590678 [Polyporus arcularius HHB13444]